MDSSKQRRDQLKAAGLCTYCGKNPLTTVALCEVCRQKYVVDRQKRVREERTAAGLCAQCGKEPLVTKTQCEKCRDKHKQYQATRNDRCKTNNLCERCGQVPPEDGKTQCRECLDKANASRELVKHEVYEAYGGYICNCCQETEPSFLTIDHINNDGAEMRKNTHPESTYSFYCWLRDNNWPSGFQVLCWNCQWGKRKNNGVCPHKIKQPAS